MPPLTLLERPYLAVTRGPNAALKVLGAPAWSTSKKAANTEWERFSSWELNEDKVTLRSDYSGHHPLFYHSTENHFFVSDSPLKLLELGVSAELDETALALFCQCGFFLRDRTPFKAIKATPPNARIAWTSGLLSVSGSLRIVPAASHTSESVATNYADLFSQAIKRCQPDPDTFDVLLSGGRDSRQILLELRHQKLSPRHCISSGSENDRFIAKQLADRLKLTLVTVDSNSRAMPQIWEKNLLTHMCALEHTWLMPLANHLRQHCPQVYEGTGVGVLTRSELLAPHFLQLIESDRYDELAELIVQTIGPPSGFFERLRSPWSFLSKNRDAAKDMLVEELKSHREAANPLTSFNFWNWNRRATALWPLGLANRNSQVHTPFLDRDLYDFVASIPPDLSLANEPQSAAIKKKFPEFNDIPYYDQIPPLPKRKFRTSTKVANWIDRTLLVAQSSPRDLGLLFVHAKDLTPRSKSMHFTVLQYLCQLSRIVTATGKPTRS